MIDEKTAHFQKLWNDFESKWMKWNAEEMTIWFKYKTINMNTDNIDWEKINEELKTRNISGKSLQKFNDLTFELIGLKDFEIVTHLVSGIEVLKKQFIECDDGRGSNDKLAVPKEYLCLITNQIMRDPVIAFDGRCYERSAIESYLKLHNKSPITGDEAQYIIVFPNHRLKSDIEKFIKENNIDIDTFNHKRDNEEGTQKTMML